VIVVLALLVNRDIVAWVQFQFSISCIVGLYSLGLTFGRLFLTSQNIYPGVLQGVEP